VFLSLLSIFLFFSTGASVAGETVDRVATLDRVTKEAGAWYGAGRKERAHSSIKKVCPGVAVMSECRVLTQHPEALLLAARLERELGSPENAVALLESYFTKASNKNEKGQEKGTERGTARANKSTEVGRRAVGGESDGSHGFLDSILKIEAAKAYRALGKHGKAVRVLWKLRERRGDFVWWEAVRLQADSLYEAKRYDLSAAAYRELSHRSQKPELRAFFRFREGRSYVLKGDERRGYNVLRRASLNDGASSWQWKIMEALRGFRQSEFTSSFSPKEKHLRADRLLDGLHVDEAVEAYGELASLSSAAKRGVKGVKGSGEEQRYLRKNREIFLYGLARSLLYAGQYERGLSHLKELLKKPAWRHKAGALRRSLLRRLGRYEETAGDLISLAKRSPNSDSRVRFLLAAGDAWLQAGKYSDSLKVLQKAVPRGGTSSVRFRRAYLFLKTGETSKACKAMEKVSKLRGRRMAGKYWLGVCKLRQKKQAEAVKLFIELVREERSGFYGLLSRARLKELGVLSGLNRRPLKHFSASIHSVSGRRLKRFRVTACVGVVSCMLKTIAALCRVGFRNEARRRLRWLISCLNKEPSSWSERRPPSEEHYWIGLECPQGPETGKGVGSLGGEALRSLVKIARWADEESIARRVLRVLNERLDPTPLVLERFIKSASEEWGVRPAWVWAVMRVESAYNPMVISTAGARGFMQLMPHTARRVARRLEIHPFDMSLLFEGELNVRFGGWYLGQLFMRFRNQLPLALAGYNGGPHNVALWLSKKGSLPTDEFIEEIPFTETRRYVKKTLRWIYRYSIKSGDELSDLISLKIDPEQQDNIDF